MPSASCSGSPLPEAEQRERRRRVLARRQLPLLRKGLCGPSLGKHDLELPASARHRTAHLPLAGNSSCRSRTTGAPAPSSTRDLAQRHLDISSSGRGFAARFSLPLAYSAGEPTDPDLPTFRPRSLAAPKAAAKLTPVNSERPSAYSSPITSAGPDGAPDALHPPVEPASQNAPGLGVVPRGKELARVQGWRRRWPPRRAAGGPSPATTRPGSRPIKSSNPQTAATGASASPGNPSSRVTTPGSRIPQEGAAPAHERGTEKQSEGEENDPHGLPRKGTRQARPGPRRAARPPCGTSCRGPCRRSPSSLSSSARACG